MIGVREKKKQQTRKAIIDAAIKLFTSNGFEQTSMDELARAAGIGKSTIYGYFNTKEEIFLAYCEAELDFAFAALDRKLDEEAPLIDQLVAHMMGQITFVTENREFGRIFAREMTFPGETNKLLSRELDMRYLDKLGEVLGRAQLCGELPAESELLLLIAHLHGLYLLTLSTIYRGDTKTLENAETFVRSLVWQALHGPAAIANAPAEVRADWQRLRQEFLAQRKLEI
jgi:AcrR family transcriptional regulator